jgi:hypothetical protein
VTVRGKMSNAMITPDGTRIVIPVVTQTTREFDEYSVRTGRLTAVLGVRQYHQADAGAHPVLFWTSPSGSTLIVHDARPHGRLLTANGDLPPAPFAVVTGSRFRPLPGTSDSLPAW